MFLCVRTRFVVVRIIRTSEANSVQTGGCSRWPAATGIAAENLTTGPPFAAFVHVPYRHGLATSRPVNIDTVVGPVEPNAA